MRVRLCLIGLPLALSTGLAHAAPRSDRVCSRNVMCVETRDHGDTVDFYVDNRQSAPITVTLHVDAPIGATTEPLPYTQTYPGLARTLAVVVTKASPGDPLPAYRFAWDWGSLDAHNDPNYLYSLPYAPGTAHLVAQGWHGAFSHTGDFAYAIDFAMPVGTPIYAARGGIVVGTCARYTKGGPERALENRVNYIMIEHEDGTVGEYDHLEHDGVRVTVGERVHTGELIGYSGDTGFTTGPHLHFFVYKAMDGAHRESFPIHFKGYANETLVTGGIYTRPSALIATAPTPSPIPPGSAEGAGG